MKKGEAGFRRPSMRYRNGNCLADKLKAEYSQAFIVA